MKHSLLIASALFAAAFAAAQAKPEPAKPEQDKPQTVNAKVAGQQAGDAESNYNAKQLI